MRAPVGFNLSWIFERQSNDDRIIEFSDFYILAPTFDLKVCCPKHRLLFLSRSTTLILIVVLTLQRRSNDLLRPKDLS
jgi:hypothetical protein